MKCCKAVGMVTLGDEGRSVSGTDQPLAYWKSSSLLTSGIHSWRQSGSEAGNEFSTVLLSSEGASQVFSKKIKEPVLMIGSEKM